MDCHLKHTNKKRCVISYWEGFLKNAYEYEMFKHLIMHTCLSRFLRLRNQYWWDTFAVLIWGTEVNNMIWLIQAPCCCCPYIFYFGSTTDCWKIFSTTKYSEKNALALFMCSKWFGRILSLSGKTFAMFVLVLYALSWNHADVSLAFIILRVIKLSTTQVLGLIVPTTLLPLKSVVFYLNWK